MMQTPPRQPKHFPSKAAEEIANVTPTKLNNLTLKSKSADVNQNEKSEPSNTTSGQATKRLDYLAWEDYFMSVAFLSAQRSKDPSSQVGACIVNEEKKIVGIGYNGMPNGCNDDVLPWSRDSEDWLETKYPYVCHAELNAIMNKNSADVKGCTMYVALFPCNECAKVIIQSGIRKIVFLSDRYQEKDTIKASKRMFDYAGVTYSKFTPSQQTVTIDFYALDPEARPKDENQKEEEL
ncbi:deoxycytidylate deaminase isoform X2 [Strongylocentrotus purpuratus]|uniref:dCMP deaminase n=1 Tax=Strongylocentrotus purpuratus TaxID=7668 RepID=A0A7M7RCA3_STRPU|nr:deoxycytidylate deaminase isoform X2 [Strongylocentrotus purpuratus]|eukprot:XP_781375.3 PREDICTED: deoxycytidylate deaminase isoform X2 [Strongylocentrotus purpuratus]